MPDDSRVLELVGEVLESDRTPEEVCRDIPELLPAVRKRLMQVQQLDDQLDAIFGDKDRTRLATVPPQKCEFELPMITGYNVDALLGRGGMGIVFKARHLKLNRIVALKMLLAGSYARPEELARFHREAEAVAALRHPNIVQVYDAGDIDGRPFYTMEFVEGGTLAENLTATKIEPRRAAELVAILASAVQFAHQSGFIHRDIKPGNILLGTDGTPKITDFGLVRSVHVSSDFTHSGAQLGTPSYMATEQASGKASTVGPPADIYALGAVLYAILTGHAPHEGESVAETIQKVINDEPTPPSRTNTNVPRDLETICLKCLQKNPARRYASAQDLADDLHRFLDGKPVTARPVGVMERTVKWMRRRPAMTVAIGTCLALIVTAPLVGLWLRQQTADLHEALAHKEKQARQAIETALMRASELRSDERWQDELRVLTEATSYLSDANSPTLAEKINTAKSEIQVAAKLERTRESTPRHKDGPIDYSQWSAEFAAAFAFAGLKTDGDVDLIAAQIRSSGIRPQLVAALEDRAHVAFMNKDDAQAERSLQIARSVDPDPNWRDPFRDAAKWKNRKQLEQLANAAFDKNANPTEHQLTLLGLLLRKAGSLDLSMRMIAEARRRQPKNFRAAREMALAQFMEYRWTESAASYRAAIKLQPANADSHWGLAIVMARVGQTEDAINEYRKAVELAPQASAYHTHLVETLANGGYWKDADAACRRALEVDPANHHAPHRLAEALFASERFEEAIAVCRQATESAPMVAEMKSVLGAFCAKVERHNETAKAFRKADKQRDPAVKLAQARLHVDRMEWEQAAKHFAEAMELEPTENGEVWFEYAAVQLLAGDKSAYRQSCARMLGSKTTSQLRSYHVARACTLAPNGTDDWSEAIRLSQNELAGSVTFWARTQEGALKARSNRAADAIADFERSLAMDARPGRAVVNWLWMALCQHKIGNHAQAKIRFEKAIHWLDQQGGRMPTETSAMGLHRHNWLEAHILRREAEALLAAAK